MKEIKKSWSYIPINTIGGNRQVMPIPSTCDQFISFMPDFNNGIKAGQGQLIGQFNDEGKLEFVKS